MFFSICICSYLRFNGNFGATMGRNEEAITVALYTIVCCVVIWTWAEW